MAQDSAVNHQDFVQQQQLKAAAVAAAVLAGTESHIRGVRSILSFLSAAGLSTEDEDFLGLLALDSETDELPVGEERSRWSPEALSRLDPQLVAAEKHAKEHFAVFFANIVNRFGPSNQPLHPDASRASALSAGKRRR